jgi:hypothetical protein
MVKSIQARALPLDERLDRRRNYNDLMRRRFVVAIALVAASISSRSTRAVPATPVLVELFTSEGCSSCPPADDLLARLLASQPIEGARVVALGEHVDYWDQLGWKDRFSSAALTNRQHIYANRLSHDGPYTPQLVIDGRAECVGSDAAAARRAIANAATAAHGTIAIAIADGRARLTVSALPQKPTDHADVLLAVTEDDLRTDVKRGENHGRTLSHVAVVRQLTRIGEVAGAAGTAEATIAIAPEWRREHLHLVAFVQERRGGAVLGSAIVPLVARP